MMIEPPLPASIIGGTMLFLGGLQIVFFGLLAQGHEEDVQVDLLLEDLQEVREEGRALQYGGGHGQDHAQHQEDEEKPRARPGGPEGLGELQADLYSALDGVGGREGPKESQGSSPLCPGRVLGRSRALYY